MQKTVQERQKWIKKMAENKTKQLEKEKREIQMQKDALKEKQNLAKSGNKYDK